MPPYQQPKLGSSLMTRFIRIGSRIFVGENNIDSFSDIIAKDKLQVEVAAATATRPADTDAGWLSVFESRAISVFGYSEGSVIPNTSSGRKKTKQEFAQQSPDYRIVGFRR